MQTFNCGVCPFARELYKSEGKHTVAVFHATIVMEFFKLGMLLPMFIAYDDACHLVQRALSLMGQHWAFAVLATMAGRGVRARARARAFPRIWDHRALVGHRRRPLPLREPH